MKQTPLIIVVLLALLVQIHSDSPPNSTPQTWSENLYTSACQAIGVPKIVQNPSSTIPLTAGEFIYLKTSYTYSEFTLTGGNDAYSQDIYKHYIIIGNNDGVLTDLLINWVSGFDGTKMTQHILISNTYEFIDAQGPFALFKQTDGSGNVLLTLYSFDSTQGATNILRLTSVSMSTYPNEIFKSVSVNLVSASPDNLDKDTNYAQIIGTVTSFNTVTSEIWVRKIIATGIDTLIYRFHLNDASSDVYTNLLLGLQITGSSFNTYVAPHYGFAGAPFVYGNDQTAITDASGLYSNHIVIPYMQSMMIATYDDDAQNGNIFFLVNDLTSYDLSLVNMKTTLTAPSGSLQYLTDYSSYIIELNLDPTVSTFYIVWADDAIMYNYTFLNSLGDHNNGQIVADFTNPTKIASIVYAQLQDDNSYGSSLYLWIYNSTNIIKYVLQETEDDSSNILSITINKEFSVELAENVLINSAGPNFQVTTQMKCVCQNTEVTEMICFYGNDACTFTVQTSSVYCTPVR